MSKILLVEDDATISQMLSAYIEREGFQVQTVANGNDAEKIFIEGSFDLVILDINLPGKTGFELLPIFRSASRVPILMLSARSWEDDKVHSLELGADDYVPKPFSARELMARINRHLVRSSWDTSSKNLLQIQDVLKVGRVTLHISKYQVYIDQDEVRLTKTEFEILAYLMKHVSQVVERETLMKEIIGYERYLSDRTIDTHIKNVRKKFEGSLNIETLRAIWYRLHPV
jgi:DNA-binding response OmpR family regulator